MEPTQPTGPRGARGAPRVGPGTRIGPYEIGALLGAGGMGEVFRARDVRLARDVAVKILPARLASDEDAARRFETEARAAASLSHPHVMAVYDVGTHDGVPYVVCELVDGKPPSGKLAPSRARELARQIAAGLAAAHEKGIVHRDLKPSNVLVGKGGVKILDFGLAKLIAGEEAGNDPHTATGAVMGTPGYMSPEQVRGQPVDHRTDIFCLGVILHELLTGAPAFDGPSRVERMAATLTHEPAPPDAPPDLVRVVARCLEKDPARRFQSALDLAFALEPTGGTGTVSVVSGAQPRARHRWRAPLYLAALAVAGAVAVAIAALSWSSAPPAAAPPGEPVFERLTFRHGRVWQARFSPDGTSVFYAAAWSDTPRVSLYSVRQGSPESQPLPISAEASLLAVSRAGELALLLLPPDRIHNFIGVLARAPAGGGAPRPVLEGVLDADWGPDGELAVAHRGPGHDDTVEYPIGKVLYRSSGFFSSVRVARDGSAVAALHHPLRGDDRGEVLVFGGDGGVRLRSRTFKSARGLAWAPDGAVWFTASDSSANGALRVLDDDGDDRVVAAAPGRLLLHDIAADGRMLISREDARMRLKVSPPGVRGEIDLSWFDWTTLADLSTDGKQVLFYESGEAGGDGYRTYLRATDGSPAVLLGAGVGSAISPDGRWVLLASVTDPARLELVPTGAGQARSLDPGGLDERVNPAWVPDGRVIYSGRAAQGLWRIYVQSPDGAPQPIGEPGLRLAGGPKVVTHDGKAVAALREEAGVLLVPLAGGAPRPVKGLERHERLGGFDAEGNAFVYTMIGFPCRVSRLDPATGERRALHELELPEWETAGAVGINRLVVTPDGMGYAYSLLSAWGDLYVATGLR